MYKFFCALIIFCTSFTGKLHAQDTLPSISVKNNNGRIIISWKNSYGANISNINIQRSLDSTKRFTTIGSVLNPMNRENGFVDNKFPGGKVFYRVFVAFEGGNYLFSPSSQPILDTGKSVPTLVLKEEMEDVKPELKHEAGKPAIPLLFVPSKLVYTGKDNNVIISLSNAASRKFSIRFFDDKDQPLFELPSIREPYLILDKVNFLRSGWFHYHLYDNEILMEKYKFYIPKDGKTAIGIKNPDHR